MNNYDKKTNFSYMSKEYCVSINNAKYITEQWKKYLKSMTMFYIDFEEAMKLSKEYQKMLIEKYSRPILMGIS